MHASLRLLGTLSTLLVGALYASAADQALKGELLTLEKTWNDAHLKGDPAPLEQLWHNDLLVLVPKMQPISKNDGLAMLRSGRMKFLRYETSDLEVRLFGGSAIVTGRLQRTRQMGERELTDDLRFSKVYLRDDNAWRVILWQVSEWPSPSP